MPGPYGQPRDILQPVGATAPTAMFTAHRGNSPEVFTGRRGNSPDRDVHSP